MKSIKVFHSLQCVSDVKLNVKGNETMDSLIYQAKNISLYALLSILNLSNLN